MHKHKLLAFLSIIILSTLFWFVGGWILANSFSWMDTSFSKMEIVKSFAIFGFCLGVFGAIWNSVL